MTPTPSTPSRAPFYKTPESGQSGEWPLLPPDESDSTGTVTTDDVYSPYHPHSDDTPHGERHVLLSPGGHHKSMELLDPGHASPLRKSDFVVATFNLVATIVGGGVLSLPFSFAKAGIVPATILMIFAAVVTDFSLYILCSCSRRTGARSYGEVARHAFGPGLEIFTSALLFVFLLFVLVAYMVLVRDIWTPIVDALIVQPILSYQDKSDYIMNVKSEGNAVLLVITLLMMPFFLRTDLHSLRHNCYVGFASIIILGIGIIYRAWQKCSIQMDSDGVHFSDDRGDGSILWYTDSFADGLYAFPIIMLSFLSSFNIISVHAALVDPTRKRVRRVIDTSIGGCFVLYYMFGIAGYLYAGTSTQGNILLNFDFDDWLIMAGRIGSGVTMMLVMAIVTLPCREALVDTWQKIQDWKGTDQQFLEPHGTVEYGDKRKEHHENIPHSSHNTHTAQNENTPLVHKSNKKPHSLTSSNTIHVALTFSIIGVCLLGAIMAPGVAIVWSLCGSSMGFLIAFILPSACYIKIRHKRKGHMNDLVLSAWLLLIVSTLGAVACTSQTIWRMLYSLDGA